MNTPFLLIIALALFISSCTSIQAPVVQNTARTCMLSRGEMETRKILASNNHHHPTLIYVRADWSAPGVTKNDTYVPSPKFLKTLESTQCLIVDVTKSGSDELIKNFGSDGIPFFVLLDSDNQKISMLRWGRSFDEFKIWFDSTKPLVSK